MIRGDVKGWFDWVNIELLKKSIGKRNVYIWGAYLQGEYVLDFLSENNIQVTGFIDSHKEGREFCNKKVTNGMDLNCKKDFIIIVLNKFRDEIIDYLRVKRFEINKDYIYIYKQFTIENTFNYEDVYGNVIIGNVKDIKVNFIGYNNLLIIGNVNILKNNQLIELNIYNNSSLIIGDNTSFFGDVQISANNNSAIKIGTRCQLEHSTNISANYNSKIEVKDKCTFGHDLKMVASEQSNITINEDCMISYYVNIRAGNGHSLFDLDTKDTISKSESILLNEHVWIGMDCTLLGGCNIGSNSILGAKSLLNKKVESNNLLVGIPAHVIRSNVDWDRKSNLLYEEWKK